MESMHTQRVYVQVLQVRNTPSELQKLVCCQVISCRLVTNLGSRQAARPEQLSQESSLPDEQGLFQC